MARRVLGPATLRATQAVSAALVADDRVLLLGCSGGADSLALAVATAVVARRTNREVRALIVDHQLQSGSGQVARECQDQLTGLGIAAEILAVTVERDAGTGLEAAARTARYAALHAAAGQTSTILLGHTLDDQAETVLLGLARGSGLRSLTGMAVRSGGLVRPLLGLRRADSEQVCAEVGLVPWQDPHNSDPGYARVRVRATALPTLEAEIGPGIAEALARTADLARVDADFVDGLAEQADPGTATLGCGWLGDQPTALRRRVLRRWLQRCGATAVSYERLLAVEALVCEWHGQAAIEVPGLAVRRSGDRLSATRSDHEN